MTLLPVIDRELRGAARHPFTYYLRGVGAGALLLASLAFGLNHGFGPNLGGRLFGDLHAMLFWAIWVFVPVLTADCISRERREGTLGLLFLTRLKASDIVVAKSLAQGLRALTLWLAVLPVVTIPLLLGGVSWGEATLSVLVNSSAICWALAAGLLASALCRVWVRALIYAACLSFTFCLAFSLLHLVLVAACWGSFSQMLVDFSAQHWDVMVDEAFGLATNWDGFWSFKLWGARGVAGGRWLWGSATASLFSLLVLQLAIRFAAWTVRRVWRESPPAPGLVWLEKKFCQPVLFLPLLRRWMRHKLEANPVGWLEQRSWSGRLVMWGWVAVIVCIYSAVVTDSNLFRGDSDIHEMVAWLLAGSLALSAAGSFRRERETGVLELLLVSPLGESELITGRLRGLWGQFLPAAGALLVLWSYLSILFPYSSRPGVILFYATSFLSLPVIGLYYSLSCRNFITAFLATLATGLLLAVAIPMLIAWMLFLYDVGQVYFLGHLRPSGGAAVCQLILAGLCWRRLYRRLKTRTFSLEHAHR